MFCFPMGVHRIVLKIRGLTGYPLVVFLALLFSMTGWFVASFLNLLQVHYFPQLIFDTLVAYTIFALFQGVFWYYGIRMMIRGFRTRKSKSIHPVCSA